MSASTSGVAEFVQYRQNVRNGYFFCGESTDKGRTVIIKNSTLTDKLGRYSDRYITCRRIGNTCKDYPYFSDLLGDQLLSFVGLKNTTSTKTATKPGATRGTAAEIDAAAVLNEDGEDGEIERDEDDENEVVEDEFEEFDDDDYNAEKYFDDGDGDGDIDDAGEADYS